MEEVVVTRKYQVTIPKRVREKLGIRVGDRLVVKEVGGSIVLEPVKPERALETLESVAERFFGGSQRVDAVRLVEESLEREARLH